MTGKSTVKQSSGQFFKQKPYNNNINKMFYEQFTQKNKLKKLYEQGYRELVKINEALQSTSVYLQKLQKKKGHQVHNEKEFQSPEVKQNKKDEDLNENGIHNPETSKLIQKFKELFFDKPEQYAWSKYIEQNESHLQRLYILEKQKARRIFQNLVNNFNKKNEEGEKENEVKFGNMVFQKILKSMAAQVKSTVFLPSTIKVILAGINWIDKDNNIGSLAMKIQIKVHIPGFNNYPNIYLQMLKNKFKFSIKTQSHSYLRNKKIDLKKSSKETIAQICKGNDIFNDKLQTKIFENPSDYFKAIYKWKNYYNSDDFVLKKLNGFEGCIIQAFVNDARVIMEAVGQTSLTQMLDLKGFVEIQPITTEMKEWSSILFDEEKSQFRRFLQEVSPPVSIKFNILSFYEDQKKIEPSKQLLINQIYSFDEMEKDDYKLASGLMLLEITNSRKSKYKLSGFGYRWSRLPEEELKPMRKLQYIHKKQPPKAVLLTLKNNQKVMLNFLEFFDKKNIKKIENEKEIEKYLMDLKQYLTNNGSDELKDKIDLELQYNLKNLQILEGLLYQLEIKTKRDVQKIQAKLSEHMKYQKYKQKKREEEAEAKKDKTKNEIQRKQQCKLQVDYEKQIERLQFTVYEIKKLRLEIKKINQYYIQRLVFEKKKQQTIRESPKGITKQLEEIKKYKSGQIMDKQYEYNDMQKKYDDDYSQSKAIFHFPIYKPPGHNLYIFLISIAIVCCLNLAIFFQEPSLQGRIANIATIMLFFIGMTAFIQKQLKSSLWIQIMLYVLFSTPFICLLHSCFLPSFKKDKEFKNYVWSSYTFLFCLIVTVISGFLIIIQYFFFRIHEKYSINLTIMKQTQALYLLLPGSQQIDKILHLKNYNKIKNQKKSLQQKKLKVKKLHRVLITLMMKHINQIFQLETQKKQMSQKMTQTILISLNKIQNKQIQQRMTQKKQNSLKNTQVSYKMTPTKSNSFKMTSSNLNSLKTIQTKQTSLNKKEFRDKFQQNINKTRSIVKKMFDSQQKTGKTEKTEKSAQTEKNNPQ